MMVLAMALSGVLEPVNDLADPIHISMSNDEIDPSGRIVMYGVDGLPELIYVRLSSCTGQVYVMIEFPVFQDFDIVGLL
jgi:hypothetical protein